MYLRINKETNMTPRYFSDQDKQALEFVINMTTDCKLTDQEVEDLIELIRDPTEAIENYKELV
jgi:hypothetical protein